MGQHHDIRFPNESDDYRAARDALLTAEAELRRQLEAVAAQRRELPPQLAGVFFFEKNRAAKSLFATPVATLTTIDATRNIAAGR